MIWGVPPRNSARRGWSGSAKMTFALGKALLRGSANSAWSSLAWSFSLSYLPDLYFWSWNLSDLCTVRLQYVLKGVNLCFHSGCVIYLWLLTGKLASGKFTSIGSVHAVLLQLLGSLFIYLFICTLFHFALGKNWEIYTETNTDWCKMQRNATILIFVPDRSRNTILAS